MKYLPIVLALTLSACSTVTIHSDAHHQLLDQNGKAVTVIGSPRITCYDRHGKVLADGFFVRSYDNGDILVDEFGNRYVHIYHPDCDLNAERRK